MNIKKSKISKMLYSFFFGKKKPKKKTRRKSAVSSSRSASSIGSTPQRVPQHQINTESAGTVYDLSKLREQVSQTEYIANLRIGRSWVLPQMVKMGFTKSAGTYKFDIDKYKSNLRKKYGSDRALRRNVWQLLKRNFHNISNLEGTDPRAKWWTKDVLIDVMEWDLKLAGKKQKGLNREECIAIINSVQNLHDPLSLCGYIDRYDTYRMRNREPGKSVSRSARKIPESFVNAYMGDGAYCAMMTMVKVWGLRIPNGENELSRDECIDLINKKSNELDGYQLMRYCKETFFDTGIFDFSEYERRR